jgi:hypothetical protein
MTKTLIGSIVGGILIFIWQFLSWTVLDTHKAAMQYTPKQDSVLSYLSSQFSGDGSYIMPRSAPGTSMEECKKQMQSAIGKPWAQVVYHTSMKDNMGSSMMRNLVVNIIAIWLLCWIFSGFSVNNFSKTFLGALFVGLIIFLQGPYVMHIWYESFDVWAHLVDYLVSWALVGLWLGWWLNRKPS